MNKALIIIDMINRDVPTLWNRSTIVKNQLALIDAFRKHHHKVIIVGGKKSGIKRKQSNPVMKRLWGEEGVTDTHGNKVISALLDTPHDLYIEKKEYSAFYKTTLEAYLRRHNITEIYLAGIYTGCCVYFTGADAAMRGIQPIIVSDATASPSKERTKENIENFKVFMGPAMTTKGVMTLLQQKKR